MKMMFYDKEEFNKLQLNEKYKYLEKRLFYFIDIKEVIFVVQCYEQAIRLPYKLASISFINAIREAKKFIVKEFMLENTPIDNIIITYPYDNLPDLAKLTLSMETTLVNYDDLSLDEKYDYLEKSLWVWTSDNINILKICMDYNQAIRLPYKSATHSHLKAIKMAKKIIIKELMLEKYI